MQIITLSATDKANRRRPWQRTPPIGRGEGRLRSASNLVDVSIKARPAAVTYLHSNFLFSVMCPIDLSAANNRSALFVAQPNGRPSKGELGDLSIV